MFRRSGRPHVTLEEAVRRYLVFFRNEFGATDRSVTDYGMVLRRFCRLYPDSTIDEWEPPAGTEELRALIDRLWGKSAPGTRGKGISVFKSFFKWCEDAELLEVDPARKLRRPKRRGSDRRAHEPEEIKRIIQAQPNLADRVGIALMAKLGLRKNELRLLRFDAIDFDRGRITIHGKGGKVAHLRVVDQRLLADLRALDTGETPYVLHPVRGDTSKPYEPSSMHRWFSKCLERAGVPHFPMHELRHSAATNYLRATGDLEKTRKFMRHESVATTQIYSHLLEDEVVDGQRLAEEQWS